LCRPDVEKIAARESDGASITWARGSGQLVKMAQNAIEHSNMQLIVKHNFPVTALPITVDELENVLSAANITCSAQGLALIQRATGRF
jgi:6-phosphogluconate dehydrogenase